MEHSLLFASCDCFLFLVVSIRKGSTREIKIYASHIGQDGLLAASGTRAVQHSVIVPPLAQSAYKYSRFPSIPAPSSNFNSQPALSQLPDAVPGLLHLNIANARKLGT